MGGRYEVLVDEMWDGLYDKYGEDEYGNPISVESAAEHAEHAGLVGRDGQAK